MRTAVRFPIRLSIDITTDGRTIHAITEDISANGVLFSGPEMPAVDTKVEFTMWMPAAIMGATADVEIRCAGRIVRRQPHGSQMQAAAVIDEYYLRI